MGEARSLADRLRHGLARIDAESGGLWEGEALKTLRRSIEITLARIDSGTVTARFRFQNTGGKPLLLQGVEALPIEPERLFSLLNAMEIQLQPGEALDLDGGLAGWLIRPEVNLTDSNVRTAEENLRVLRADRDKKDHAAIQSADSTRIRLRGKLAQLIGALQAANKNEANTAPTVTVDRETAMRVAPNANRTPAPVKQETTVRPAPAPVPAAPPPPPPAPVQRETAVRPAPQAAPPAAPAEPEAPAEGKKVAPTADILARALRKVMAALDGMGFKSAVIGDVAHLSWGFRDRPIWNIELMVIIGEKDREKFLSAARGEGLFLASSSSSSLSLRFVDKKMGTTAEVEVIDAMTPVYKEMIARAKPDFVLDAQVKVACCEDLIVLRTGSEEPGHRESVIHLLRTCAARIDPTYLKAVAQKFDVLEELKSIWQEAKKPTATPTEAPTEASES